MTGIKTWKALMQNKGAPQEEKGCRPRMQRVGRGTVTEGRNDGGREETPATKVVKKKSGAATARKGSRDGSFRLQSKTFKLDWNQARVADGVRRG